MTSVNLALLLPTPFLLFGPWSSEAVADIKRGHVDFLEEHKGKSPVSVLKKRC